MNSLKLNKNRDENYLTWVFTGYFYLLLFIGRIPSYQQPVIWIVGPVFVIIVMIAYLQNPFPLPKEILVYAAFWLWCLTGYLNAIDLGPYFRYFRLIFTILVLIICSEIVLIKTGAIQSVFKLFILIGLSYFFYDIISGQINTSEIGEEGWRYAGLISDSNWNAYMSFTALTGVAFFWNKSKKLSHRIIQITLFTVFISSVVLSASRGGFITTLVFLTVWLLLSNLDLFKKNKFVFIVIIIIMYPILIFLYDFLIVNTFLGERITHTVNTDAEITDEKRVQLYIFAFQVFLNNPVFGIGLSQFLVLTNYSAFTHSEYMELLSTTGIVGFSIMMYFYIIIFLKVWRLRKKVNSNVLLYRLNLFVALIIAFGVYGIFYTNFISIVTILQYSSIAGYANYLERKLKDYGKYVEFRRRSLSHSSNILSA